MLGPVRLRVDADDSRGFDATSATVLTRFKEWLRASGADNCHAAALAGDVGVALDWKWSYADGDLGWWRTEHLGEFLLEWCPRKLSVPPEEARSIPAAIGAFVAFLDDAGLLAPGSSPPALLGEAAAALTEEFVAAMGDPSLYGMAKSLFGAATADGVDLTDQAQLEDWMREFNARPLDQRRAVIPDAALGRRRPALPPVAPPPEAEVVASKAAAPILGSDADAPLFTGPAGGRLRRATSSRVWRAAVAATGAPAELRPHDLRHHAATLTARVPGITTKELMARIGHASPRAALIYQHATEERDRAIASYLEEIVAASRPSQRADVVALRP